jgi:hypothetical protein
MGEPHPPHPLKVKSQVSHPNPTQDSYPNHIPASTQESHPKALSDTFKNMIHCMKNKHIVIKHRARELGLSDVGTKAKLCNLILKRVEPSKKESNPVPLTVHTNHSKTKETNPVPLTVQTNHSKQLCSAKRTKKKPGELSLLEAKQMAQRNGLPTKGTKSDICKRLAQHHLVRLSGRRSKRKSRSR